MANKFLNNINLTAGLEANGSAGTSGQILKTTGSGIEWVNASTVIGGPYLPLAGGTMTGNIVLNDNVKSIYGTLGDGLEIFHDGNNSLIKDTGTGNLTLDTNGNQINFGGGGENFAVFRKDTSVDLFYNGLKNKHGIFPQFFIVICLDYTFK